MTTPNTKIETKRLIIDELTLDDTSNMVKYASDKRVADRLMNLPHPYTKEDAIYWINHAIEERPKGNLLIFAIRQKETKKLIGIFDFIVSQKHDRAEVSYWIGVPHWGKGYVTEALQAMIDYGFNTLGFHKILAAHFEHNPASGRVMQKSGMKYEATFLDHLKKEDKYINLIQYCILKREYNGRTQF